MIILFRHSDNTHNTHSALNQRRQWNILLFVWSITKRFGERELIRESGARIVFNRVIKFDIVILEPWSAHQRIKERKRRFSHFLGESRAYVELWITRQNIHIQLSTFTWIVTISTLWSGTKPVCFDIVHTMLPVRLPLLLLFIVQQQQQGQQQQQEPNEFYSVAYFKRCQFFGFSLNTPQYVWVYYTHSLQRQWSANHCRVPNE